MGWGWVDVKHFKSKAEKEIEQFKWYLPAKLPRRKPYLSRWRMTAQEAAAQGAFRPELTSRMVIRIAETELEAGLHRLSTDTSPGAAARAAALKALPPMLGLKVKNVKWLDDYWAPAARM